MRIQGSIPQAFVFFRKDNHLFRYDKEIHAFLSTAWMIFVKCYPFYIEAIKAFQKKYKLEQYNLKQIDKYLWQLGKHYFNRYNK